MTCDCSGGKNQTHKAVFNFVDKNSLNIASLGEGASGFGLFLVPDPETGIMEYKTVIVENLNYRETCKRGATCEAFMWIPRGYVGLVSDERHLVVDSLEALHELRQSCSDRCGHCPMNGCFCYQGESMCHRR